ncbi:MAG: hypothetical protein ATN32_00125 [Candidatus Epulonipiscium fishelsonii]|nr:MAG: hypothetical protein ATN32_00125 [Epulopiscium sp. AS2M-Bin002]
MENKGKVAIVSGGARGIGKAICQRLAEAGAKVIVADLISDLAKETSNELNSKGYETLSYSVDLSKSEQIKRMIQFAVDNFGTLDILVNNAAIQIRRASEHFKEEDWDLINDVNLKSHWIASQEAAKIMLKKGSGSIICIASGTASRATSHRSPYCITKAAVEGLARALGNEWARYGVRVNGVSPGWALTDMVKEGIRVGAVKQDEILPMMPIDRFLDPMEIANTVNFLASDQASGIIGQTIYCDGGGSIRCVPEQNYELEI